ncbi:ATP-dependent exoDNAse [Arthrobacter crystallopoietes BAB-32]|uniref:DNA 3'-5' helicase n=2 Tax=Crystallibacter crystallopoietes TaxID=37928 RepID=N1VAT2_9MICC|nr:ATP-dependent exoDNAse [Arthrobacter crystallopoietes BAB-32]
MNTVDVPALIDQPSRDLIVSGLDSTVFVEAGAGSGKTREMVERIIALVDSGVELKNLAAITFTEKAAGELRDRVHKRLREAEPTDLRQAALDQLDTAAIGTIHSFAARILSEHPIEAGVPPLITVVDELRSQIAFTQRWEKARKLIFDQPETERALRVLLAGGLSLDGLRNVAKQLDANWDRLEDNPPQRRHVPQLDVTGILRQAGEIVMAKSSCSDPNDGLFIRLAGLEDWHRRLAHATELDVQQLQLAVLDDLPSTKVSRTGNKGNWPDVGSLRASIIELGEAVTETRERLISPAAETVAAAIAEALLVAARERQRTGELEYSDLLVHARDLLIGEDKREVQAALHDRYRVIMLDEFQDTDPIQAEIAVRIAASEVCGRQGWESLTVPPGRLFMVGDPKQSIYRFRRADIATYLQSLGRAKSDPGSKISELKTNFRSTGKLLDWVNATFSKLIEANGTLQPDYSSLVPDPARPEWQDGHGPAVAVVGRDGAVPGADGKASPNEVRRQEAEAVAGAILVATGQTDSPGWLKQAGRGGQFAMSAVELKDVCILLPTRTPLPAIEDALDRAGIEYRAEASSLVYSTQEVTDLLLALQALANTADEAALVLTLRTPLFACGDDDLFDWKQAGGAWNIFAPAPETQKDTPVARAMQYLSALARELPLLSPGELLDRLVIDRRVLEAATDTPRYRDVWRRIRFVIDQARAWSEATHGGLRDYLVWTTAQLEENSRVKESVVPETDAQAVRIMTIHASKGLEFPVVILAGAGHQPKSDTFPAVWDAAGAPHVSFGAGLASAGHFEAAEAEKEFLAEEKLRLLYVACTRAESHLVVSLFTSGKRHGLIVPLAKLEEARATPDLRLPDEIFTGAEIKVEVTGVDSFEEWKLESRRWQELSALQSRTSVTALAKSAGSTMPVGYGLEKIPLYVAVEDEGDRPLGFAGALGEHGTEFGSALHRLLELSGLQETESFGQLAEQTAALYGMEDALGLADRARSALNSEPVRSASTREHWLELPVVYPSGSMTVEGIIDLMYRKDDGKLVIADFKTDLGVTEERLAAYWNQLTTYAAMINKITGEKVSDLALIFCRSSEADVRKRLLA